jgi:hypothetical protein
LGVRPFLVPFNPFYLGNQICLKTTCWKFHKESKIKPYKSQNSKIWVLVPFWSPLYLENGNSHTKFVDKLFKENFIRNKTKKIIKLGWKINASHTKNRKHTLWHLGDLLFLWWNSDQNKEHKVCRAPSYEIFYQL